MRSDDEPRDRITDDRIATARATLSRLAGSYSERALRPISDAVELALDSIASHEGERVDTLLDSVAFYAASLAEAEAQVSELERSVRADLASAAALLSVRTDAHLASAYDVSMATAAASAALLDVDNARSAGSLHDPVDLLDLLGEADMLIDDAISGYRTPSEQARRQVAAIGSAQLRTRIRTEAVGILCAAHPTRVSEAARHLRAHALQQLEAATALLATDPESAHRQATAAASHATDALDAALLDLTAVVP